MATTADDRDDILETVYALTQKRLPAAYARIANAMFAAVRIGGGHCTGL